jgi:hypothetical protein
MVLQMIKVFKKVVSIALVFLYLSVALHAALAHLNLLNDGQDKDAPKTGGMSFELETSWAEESCFACLIFSSQTQVNNVSKILYRPQDLFITHLYHFSSSSRGVYFASARLRAPPFISYLN